MISDQVLHNEGTVGRDQVLDGLELSCWRELGVGTPEKGAAGIERRWETMGNVRLGGLERKSGELNLWTALAGKECRLNIFPADSSVSVVEAAGNLAALRGVTIREHGRCSRVAPVEPDNVRQHHRGVSVFVEAGEIGDALRESGGRNDDVLNLQTRAKGHICAQHLLDKLL